MSPRKRHPDKDWEALLRQVEAQGWRVTRKKGYFQLWCPCGDHRRSVPLTPSGGRTLLNVRKWLSRCSCWKETP